MERYRSIDIAVLVFFGRLEITAREFLVQLVEEHLDGSSSVEIFAQLTFSPGIIFSCQLVLEVLSEINNHIQNQLLLFQVSLGERGAKLVQLFFAGLNLFFDLDNDIWQAISYVVKQDGGQFGDQGLCAKILGIHG